MNIKEVMGFYGNDELSEFIKRNLELYYKLALYKLLMEKSIKLFKDISSDNEN